MAIDCQYGTAAPPGVHQGAGLLAIDPGDQGPVEIFAAVKVAEQVPVIQARVCDGYLIVSADGAVTRRTDAGGGGLTGALGRWAAEFAARAGVPRGWAAPGSPGLVLLVSVLRQSHRGRRPGKSARHGRPRAGHWRSAN